MIEAVAQVGNEVDDFDVGVQADDLALPGAKRRQLDGDLVAGDDVGVDRGQRQQGGQVGELPYSRDGPQLSARGVDLDGGGGRGKRRTPVPRSATPACSKRSGRK